jgi:protein-S-isoprenylcysteine O-methyltransferase
MGLLPPPSSPDRPRVLLRGGLLSASVVLHALWGLSSLSSDVATFRWCAYVCLLCSFHLLEYAVTALYQPPGRASSTSFLLNHSPSYHAAVLASALEFWVERWTGWGWDKTVGWWGVAAATAPPPPTGASSSSSFPLPLLSAVGLAMVVVGQALRSLAMATAGASFSHLIATRKESSHALVTGGVYGLFRHPSYTGWQLWSVGTQLLLLNPVCAVLYLGASWKFFRDRIPFEEHTLLAFFGGAYVRYARGTRTSFPWLGTGVFPPFTIASPADAATEEQADRLAAEYRRDAGEGRGGADGREEEEGDEEGGGGR